MVPNLDQVLTVIAGGLGTLGPNSGADSITPDVELTGVGCSFLRGLYEKLGNWGRTR
jgi:hypothetical protein